MLTPAVSVLSALEGVGSESAGLKELILPFALIVLIGLFVLQRFGTDRIGKLFGPVMVRMVHRHRLAGRRRHRPEPRASCSPPTRATASRSS